MRKGFTLVELSIVLVIIGLLIGGILVAQSMISTARVSNFINTVQQFDVAVLNFKDKYKELPGDTMKFGPIADNDGYIEDHYASCCAQPTIFRSEILNFWPHLQISGFKIKGVSGNLPVYTGAYENQPINVAPGSQNVPKMDIGKNIGVIPYATGADFNAGGLPFTSGAVQVGEFTPRANYYFFADFTNMVTLSTAIISSGGNATRNWKENIPVGEVMAIDVKIDDGIANRGKVLNGSYGSSTNCVASAASTAYSTNPAGLCALIVKMGI